MLLDGASGISQPLIESPAFTYYPALSPDGRWLAYCGRVGRKEVILRSFPDGGARVQVSAAGGEQPRWSRGGSGLYYVQDQRLMCVACRREPRARALGAGARVRPRVRLAVGRGLEYDVTPDRAEFVVNEGDRRTVGTPQVVLSWPRMFERMQPR